MKLLTKEIEEKFNIFPFGLQDGLGGNSEVLVKYFNPCGAISTYCSNFYS